ncbi:MAG: HAMP domain-containing sensor histidine kinase [Campylobacterota bacterium]|nr:HAMP domain-containing sensor histidine kinase [Campylobacterota bacterium]
MYNFKNISLYQVNALAIFFILLFTILFSTLLIHEEYSSFEKNIIKEEQKYLIGQYDEIKKVSHRIDKLIEYYMKHTLVTVEDALKNISEIFNDTGRRFIQVYNSDLELLQGSLVIDLEELKHIDFESEVLNNIHVKTSDSVRDAIVSTKVIDDYIVISGLYTHSSDTFFSIQIKEMKGRLVRIILEIVTLSFILFGFILGINKIVATMLERDVNSFLSFFGKAAKSSEYMDPDKTFFKEFHLMITQANSMVRTINNQKASLEQLNLSLEDKVHVKTLALEEQNSALEKEKAFSQDVLSAQRLFLRHAVHETNTPLSVIMANIDLFTLKEGSNKYLSKIDAAVKNIFIIYDDLSYMVKRDQVQYPSLTINLKSYIKSRIEFFKEVARLSHLNFKYTCKIDESSIVFNETKLQRIVDNNIGNAIKYTIPNETIYLNLEGRDDRIIFEIFSKSYKIEDVKRIFDPFYQELHESSGFGVGLSLVHSICNQEDVTINLESDDDMTRFSYGFKRTS